MPALSPSARPCRRAVAATLFGLALAGCGSAPAPEAAAAGLPPPLLLVSLDAVRWDFPARAATPALDRIAAAGVRAERLIPVFPTKTFPNHYTIVTGLYPEHHGIVANNIYDPARDARFSLADRDAVEDPRWWGGEPVWVTAQRQGLGTAAFFWPGSEAPILGVQPDRWRRYDHSIANETRVDQLLAWLDLPAGERPSLLTAYFSDVDDAAHRYDPDGAPQVVAAVERVDRAIGRLIAGLERRGLWGAAHLLVVSDHGMAANSPERVIVLDDYVDLGVANVVDWNPVAALWPEPARVEEVYRQLAGAHPNLAVYRKQEIPERFHYRDNPRIPPILAVADEGWRIASRAYLEARGGRLGRGEHGYDPAAPSMGAIFYGAGPGLAEGAVVPAFENVHLYELICHLLGLEPAPNDGSLEAVRGLLRRPAG